MKLVDKIINYGIYKLDTKVEDAVYLRNRLCHLLNTYNNEHFELGEKEEFEKISTFNMYSEIRGYIEENFDLADYEVEEKIDEIFGLLEPLPSEVIRNFYAFKDSFDSLMYLKRLGENSNYINLNAINKNYKWSKQYNCLIEYTINLSKPEKSNKDIAAALKMKTSADDAPKCVLCPENEGYYGSAKKAARSSIRLIPLEFSGNDKWYLQFSPYVYFENHIILINSKHVPMVINSRTIERFIEFVDKYPTCFIGSNADLPIVGGSILSHEHYQGGTYELPIFKSGNRYEIVDPALKESKVYYCDWFNSTLKIISKNPAEIEYFAKKIMDSWQNYDNEKLYIYSHTGETRHNTVTPIMRKLNGNYVLYLILRCNYCTENLPDGVFHVHPEYFNIKKEGIGLIEAQGLFILPGRLFTEISLIEEYLKSNKSLDEYLKEHENLIPHKEMIIRIEKSLNKEQDIRAQIFDEISRIGREILKNTAVFKEDQKEELRDYLNKANLKLI